MDIIGLLPTFGNVIWTILATIVALSVIIAIHEYGHYIVGRWSGIQAEVFSLGFGPTLWSRMDRRGTRWQIAALPFGGYVKFLGDANAASGTPDDATLSRLSPAERRHTLHGAPLWARAATVAAGPVFNFILSIVVFAGLFMFDGKATEVPTVGALITLPGPSGDLRPGDQLVSVNGMPTPDYAALNKAVEALTPAPLMDYRVLRDGGEIEVKGPVLYPARADSVTPASAAYDAGMEKGDVILSANGTDLIGFGDLQTVVKAANGAPLTLKVWREGAVIDMALTPRRTDLPLADGGFETRYLIGISGALSFSPATVPLSPLTAVKEAALQTWFIGKSSLSGLYHVVTGAISTCSVQGTIGIAKVSGAAAAQGLQEFIGLIALLSTAVGLLNLFPIPILDGGHLVFHAWEWATGKPPSNAALNILMTLGLAVIVGLMVFSLTNDIICP